MYHNNRIPMEIRHTISPTTKHELETFYFTDSKNTITKLKWSDFKMLMSLMISVLFDSAVINEKI